MDPPEIKMGAKLDFPYLRDGIFSIGKLYRSSHAQWSWYDRLSNVAFLVHWSQTYWRWYRVTWVLGVSPENLKEKGVTSNTM